MRRQFFRREYIGGTAEFAGHGDPAVLDHIVAIGLREAFEHVLDVVARARALRIDRGVAEDAHAAFVKQPVSQPLARKIGIEQFEIVDGVDQRAALDPGFILRQRMQRGAGRRIAGMQVSLPGALGRSRQELQQDAAGAPMPVGAV